MPQERTEAIVLRSVDFSETSRIVTFLSPDRGRLACMVRGVKRPRNQLAALLDTFNRLELVYYWRDGRSVQQLSDAALLDGYAGIKGNLEKASFAAFPLELAYKAAHENEPSRELYEALCAGLEALNAWPGDVRMHACWQVLQLLSAAGFEPRLDVCAECGKAVGPVPGFAFRSGVTCPACAADLRLSASAYETLRALAESRAICPVTAGSGEVFRIVRRYAAHQIMSDFQSVRVIDQMFYAVGKDVGAPSG